ncbi:MAG: tRNA (adenosine(37)-N6)-threonylcarbamoyltransferase complex ATPase subunit type 1 TsaE [Candidatus Yanofskybacteria bacterium]|nr:tRNA (adenosine(37)-N6)-threonylcarbamoyltransferase complex ATPase subunit type 1 TsaE [Candidatus Yanofskybacteria bacterium]
MGKKSTIQSQSEEETRQIAEQFAKTLPFKKEGALVVALSGDLGAGKTVFAQGFARGLGALALITSPTFLLIRHTPLSGSHFSQFVHIDCYRLEDPAELLALGLREVLSEAGNVVLIEWADRIRGILPADTIWVSLSYAGDQEREITIQKEAFPGIGGA